jgi:TldD protein
MRRPNLGSELIAAGEEALAAVAGLPGVDYADVRVSEEDADLISLRDGGVDKLEQTTSRGVGVRVLHRGAWGFAAVPSIAGGAGARAARQAAEIARAVSAAQRERVELAPEEPQVGTYETPARLDPFELPLQRRLDDLDGLMDALMAARAALSAIRSVSVTTRWRRTRKAFLNTEGSRTEQCLGFGGAGFKVIAADDRGIVRRTWPMDFDGGLAARGYEHLADLDLLARVPETIEELRQLLAAPPCPPRSTALVLDTPQLTLQIHESCGHPMEGDRALGEELSLAGGSFLTPDKLGRFTYGSSLVNLTADSLDAGGLGTFGWDDEGVPARRTPLVRDGQFVGYLSSRDTARALGATRSAGCMRAESWNRPPIIRMTNVSLAPDPSGPASLEELVAETDDGILMATNTSWSIDDLRLHFQFGCESAWEIKRGRRTRLFRNPIYRGATPAFWGACDAICGPAAFRLAGLVSCGKGDPIQGMAVGHGCAPARFRGIDVGSA